MGVLSGVALLNYAYETMFQAFALAKEQDRVIHASVSYTHLDVYKRQVSAFILSILRCLQCLWRISQGLEVRLQTGFLD